MSSLNFAVGNLDLSQYVEVETYSVGKVWEKAAEFKAMNGNNTAKYSGFRYQIQADFEGLPDTLMNALSEAVNSDGYTVSFSNPTGGTSAVFNRAESIKAEAAYILDGEICWNTSVSITSEFIPADGL